MRTISLDRLMEHGFQIPSHDSEEEIINRIEQQPKLETARRFLNTLNEPDRTIFELHASGIRQVEIAKLVFRDKRSVSKSLQRTKCKLLIFLKTATSGPICRDSPLARAEINSPETGCEANTAKKHLNKSTAPDSPHHKPRHEPEPR